MPPGRDLCEHLESEGLLSSLFSDITVSFQDKEYKLHKIIISQSLYFKSLLSGPWKESGKPRVELKLDDENATVGGLEIAIAYMYGVSPELDNGNVLGVLAAGCFLCLECLCEQCVDFMVADIREETFLSYQQMSERHCYGHYAEKIRDACWSFLCVHAARELLHLLPKLSLPLLCRLLKSDELWVTDELERYNFAKQVLLEWKLARIRSSTSEGGGSSKRQRVAKSNSARKAAKVAGAVLSKTKDRGGKSSSKDKAKKKAKEKQQTDEANETPLKKLRRLWEEDASDDAEASKEGFDMVEDLFCGGGIIFTYISCEGLLLVRREMEDASMPTDLINDAVWQNLLIKGRASSADKKSAKQPYYSDSEYGSESESSESSEDSDSNSIESLRLSVGALTRVTFSDLDEADFDGTRRKTTGGFSWAAKLHPGMLWSDFPPCRFAVEFLFRDRMWRSDKNVLVVGDAKWSIVVRRDDKDYLVVLKYHSASVVSVAAKLYVRDLNGYWCAAWAGHRNAIAVTVPSEVMPPQNMPFRVVAVVQMIEDDT